MDDLLDELSTYLATEVLKQAGKEIAPDVPLISSGLIDSFHLVDLGLFIEQRFGVHIDDAELNVDTFDTLEQLTKLIRSRQ